MNYHNIKIYILIYSYPRELLDLIGQLQAPAALSLTVVIRRIKVHIWNTV